MVAVGPSPLAAAPTNPIGGYVSPTGQLSPVFAPAEGDILAQIRQSYGYVSWMMEDPELAGLLAEYVRAGWSPDEMRRRLQGTRWWQAHSAAERAWVELSGAQPAEAKSQIQAQKDAFGAAASKLGIEIAPERLEQMATDSLRFGWTPQQKELAIAAEFRYNPTAPVQGAVVGDLKEQAAQYLVPLSDATIEQWARQIVGGQVGADAFEAYLKEQAKGLFPALSAALDAGQTVRQYADPYVEIAARELQLNPNDIDLNDSKWNRPFYQLLDPKTGERGVMSLDEWREELRSNDIYGFSGTQQGEQEQYALVSALNRAMGVRR